MSSRASSLRTFVQWTAAHITGDEKGEAQIFLDRMFKGFGWDGLREAGATCETRVKNSDGGTSFADLVWKPRVVIEMKRRGTDLSRFYLQTFTYWTRLVPNRPRYAVLCNFDEFWVYDFESQLDTPVEKLALSDLPANFGALNFMFPENPKPIFGNHHEHLTRKAADTLASCFNSLVNRGIDRGLSQRFVLQTLMALFAEDIDLLEEYFVTKLLNDCKSGKDSFDLLGGLFEAMNTPGGVKGGRFKGVPYFNGGLFQKPAQLELVSAEIQLLREAAKYDWSTVRPEIFGTLFEHSLGKEERHAFGAHFTSPVDIMKIVAPTLIEPWSDAIDSASTLKGLRELLARLENFRILDPACGSGNFLYIAYREMKRIEAKIYDRIAEFRSINRKQRSFGFLSSRNFYGIDVNPFAVDIAKVTMMLAHKLSIDELHISEPALPLDNLDANFRAGDALVTPSGNRVKWFDADVIIGNPPFLGAKNLKRDLPSAYVNTVRKAYPEVPGMADFCVYWINLANRNLPECTSVDPLSGRAGLVGTQNIRSTASRRGGLDSIVKSGTIVEAVENQPWSGEAAVNVSIVNWVKTKDKALLPGRRRLWSLVDGSVKRDNSDGKPVRFDLNMREVASINSALTDRVDVSQARRLECNKQPQRVFQGFTPGYSGFVLSLDEARTLRREEPSSKHLIRPYLVGRELNTDGKPKRFLIDAYGLDLSELGGHPHILAHLKRNVLPLVQEKLKQEEEKKSDMIGSRRDHLQRWWTFWAQRDELRRSLTDFDRVIAASRTQRSPFLFHFVRPDIALGDKLQLFAFDDQ